MSKVAVNRFAVPLPPLLLVLAACSSGDGIQMAIGPKDAGTSTAKPDSGAPAAPDTGAMKPADSDAGQGVDAASDDADMSFTDAEISNPDAGGLDAAETPDLGPPTDGGPVPMFMISGTVTYDWVPAKDDINEGGVRLDYGAIAARPSRRIFVEAIGADGAPLASAVTDDAGRYTVMVPVGKTAKIRAHAEIRMLNNQPDGIPPDTCHGASWNVIAVDNTHQQAPYVMDGANTYTTDTAGADLHAALVYQGGYRDRTAAPFAIIDTQVTEVELICEGNPAPTLPVLYVNWSPNNVPMGNDLATGMIGTSFYTEDMRGISNLYLVGQAEVDTDEYDDHIVAHETGHYFEGRLFRADNLGGPHSDLDSLDPTVAFGEGFGNSISGMTFNDPVYVDTSGAQQAGGFDFDVSVAPTGDDRGIYSESSGDYLLWSLYENRDPAPNSGSFDRIYAVLRSRQRATDAMTTLQTFASYYNQVYGGAAEGLQGLWTNGLGTPFDSLCHGACMGMGDTADPFDLDNDIGNAYAATRHYPQGMMGGRYGAEFWRVYKTLVSGANAPNAHDQTRFGGYSDPNNKLGAVRWYRLVGSGQMTTVTVSNLGASNCSTDVLDMSVQDHGGEIAADYTTSGCPTATFATQAGNDYVILLFGFTTEIPSWTITVTP